MTKPVAILLAILAAILAQAILRDQLLAGLALFAISAGLLILAFDWRTPLPRLRELVRVNAGLVTAVVLLAVSMLFYAADPNSAIGFYAFVASVPVFVLTQYWNDRTARGYRLQRAGWRLHWSRNAASTAADETPAADANASFTLRSAPVTRTEIVLLTAILLLGLFLRVYQIAQFPSGLSADESRPSLEALRMLANLNYRPVFIPRLDNADLDVYFLAILFNFLGTSALVVKTWPILAGLAGIFAFYWLCHDHLDWRVALIGAFLLATSRWHIHFSRLAWGAILVPLFATLTVLFLWRGLARNRRMDFVWAGAALAAGMYTYIGFRLFPFAIVAFLIFITVRDRRFLKTHGMNLTRFAVTAGWVLAPLALYGLLHPDAFLFRTNQVFLGNNLGNADFVSRFLDNLSKALLMFNYQGPQWAEHNLPGEPMLDPAAGILFVLGLAYALWNWRKPLYFLALSWFGVITLTSVLTYENPHALRTIGNIPVVYFFVVVVLDQLWRQAAPVFSSRLMRPVTIAIVGGLMTYIAAFNFSTYFDRTQSDPNVWQIFEPDVNNAGYQIAAQRDRSDIYTSTRFYYSPTVRFLSYRVGDDLDHPFFHLFEEPAALPLRRPATRDVMFVFQHNDAQTQTAINVFYPDGALTEFNGRDEQPLTEYYTVPQAQFEATQGLIARYTPLAGGITMTRLERSLTVDWRASPPPLSSPFRAEWSGLLIVPTSDDYKFDLSASAPMTVTIDDQVRLQGTASTWTMPAAPGVHTIRAEYAGDATGSVSLAWTKADSTRESIPLSAFFAMEPPAHGLVGYYYHNNQWQETPERRIDASIDFNWGNFASESPSPGAFSVNWYGEIEIKQPGDYSFGLASDDGSWLDIDGQQLIDNGGQHTVQQVNKFITLNAGRHKIHIKYFNTDGDKSIRFLWLPPDGDSYVPVPSDVLYPKE